MSSQYSLVIGFGIILLIYTVCAIISNRRKPRREGDESSGRDATDIGSSQWRTADEADGHSDGGTSGDLCSESSFDGGGGDCDGDGGGD